jgi:murein tripeptide amidase MpaA
MMLLALALLAAAPAPLTTVAEQSGWTKTGRYDEVQALCAAFPKRYPGKVKCETFGVTPMGRPMMLLVASGDGTFSAADNKKKSRPVALFQGGIHAGEIDGKDAGFWLLRELLEGHVDQGALSKMTLVFVPVFNVDGHERFGKNQRPNQRGPEEMGWRVTAQNYNLNRDYVKTDAPETQAMVTLLHAYDPVLYVDLHVTDGAKFQPDVSVTFEPQQTGPQALRVLGQALHAQLFAELEKEGHQPLGFYPSFIHEDDPSSGFNAGWPPPRFANAYWVANNRFGVLVETHSWKDYATRVKATYDTCVGLVRLTAEAGARWLEAEHQADVADAARAGTDVTLLWEATKQSKPIDYPGYAYVREKSEITGKMWVRYDESKPEVWHVPYFGELVPSLTLKAPAVGYLIPPPAAAVLVPKLALHGIAFTRTTAAKSGVAVQTFRSEPKFRPQSFEGHQTLTLTGEWRDDTQDLPAGTLFVPASQPRLVLAMHLLEPVAPDSFVSWGLFNTSFEQKEYLEDYLTEAFAREQLADPRVKAEWEAKLKDEAFAKDPDARLRWFARRHPSADARLNLVPYYRAVAVP